MTVPFRNRKVLAWAAALVATVALVSITLAHPKQVVDPILGGEWRCSRTAFLTSCTRAVPTRQSLRNNPALFRV